MNARDAHRLLARDWRIRHHEGDVFLHHADAADGKRNRERKERLPLSARTAEKVGELVLALAEKRQVIRFVRFERREHEKAERASGLEDRAVARVLR
jgi:hypothetical protein